MYIHTYIYICIYIFMYTYIYIYAYIMGSPFRIFVCFVSLYKLLLLYTCPISTSCLCYLCICRLLFVDVWYNYFSLYKFVYSPFGCCFVVAYGLRIMLLYVCCLCVSLFCVMMSCVFSVVRLFIVFFKHNHTYYCCLCFVCRLLHHTCHILPPSEKDLGLCLAVFPGSGGKYLLHRIG